MVNKVPCRDVNFVLLFFTLSQQNFCYYHIIRHITISQKRKIHLFKGKGLYLYLCLQQTKTLNFLYMHNTLQHWLFRKENTVKNSLRQFTRKVDTILDLFCSNLSLKSKRACSVNASFWRKIILLREFFWVSNFTKKK